MAQVPVKVARLVRTRSAIEVDEAVGTPTRAPRSLVRREFPPFPARSGRTVAIKLIRPEVGNKEENIRRFQTEAQATARLCSPNAVRLYDFGVSENGTFFYVMELLKGMDLELMVRLFGPMQPERVVMLLRQACRALIEAHGIGLVHRDIKPGNLFVCELGPELDFLKVLDFGMV